MSQITMEDKIINKNLAKLEVFLDMFESHLEFKNSNQGYVLDKNDRMLGKVEVLLAKKNKRIKANFACPNGMVKANSYFDDCCVNFNITDSNQMQKGMMVFSCEDNSVSEKSIFKISRLSLTTYRKNIEANNICLYCDEFYFYYENCLTGLMLSFSPLLNGFRFEYKKIMGNLIKHFSISLDEINSKIEQVCSYDQFGECFDLTDEFMAKINPEDDIWKQMSTAISFVCPEFYQDINEIINTYDNQGINLVKMGIRNIDLKNEVLECCFGKELVKKISYKE